MRLYWGLLRCDTSSSEHSRKRFRAMNSSSAEARNARISCSSGRFALQRGKCRKCEEISPAQAEKLGFQFKSKHSDE